jgi:DNA-binding response OmpR family regulator
MPAQPSEAPRASEEAGRRGAGRLRVTFIDRDPGFMQVLARRIDARGGWDHRVLSNPVSLEALVTLRLNALVLDPAVLGSGSWDYLERVCARLPALAVIVCTGPSSVAQRVRGLRLGVDAWMTKRVIPRSSSAWSRPPSGAIAVRGCPTWDR